MTSIGAIVVIQRSGKDGNSFPVFNQDQVVFGRHQDCTIRVQLDAVQSIHCRIANDKKMMFITPANPSAKTLVNGNVIKGKTELGHRDLFTLGDRSFRWEYTAAKGMSPSKRVSWGPRMSPELIDKSMPPTSPLRKGESPKVMARLSPKKASLLTSVLMKSARVEVGRKLSMSTPKLVKQSVGDKRRRSASTDALSNQSFVTKAPDTMQSPAKSPRKDHRRSKSPSVSPSVRTLSSPVTPVPIITTVKHVEKTPKSASKTPRSAKKAGPVTSPAKNVRKSISKTPKSAKKSKSIESPPIVSPKKSLRTSMTKTPPTSPLGSAPNILISSDLILAKSEAKTPRSAKKATSSVSLSRSPLRSISENVGPAKTPRSAKKSGQISSPAKNVRKSMSKTPKSAKGATPKTYTAKSPAKKTPTMSPKRTISSPSPARSPLAYISDTPITETAKTTRSPRENGPIVSPANDARKSISQMPRSAKKVTPRVSPSKSPAKSVRSAKKSGPVTSPAKNVRKSIVKTPRSAKKASTPSRNPLRSISDTSISETVTPAKSVRKSIARTPSSVKAELDSRVLRVSLSPSEAAVSAITPMKVRSESPMTKSPSSARRNVKIVVTSPCDSPAKSDVRKSLSTKKTPLKTAMKTPGVVGGTRKTVTMSSMKKRATVRSAGLATSMKAAKRTPMKSGSGRKSILSSAKALNKATIKKMLWADIVRRKAKTPATKGDSGNKVQPAKGLAATKIVVARPLLLASRRFRQFEASPAMHALESPNIVIRRGRQSVKNTPRRTRPPLTRTPALEETFDELSSTIFDFDNFQTPCVPIDKFVSPLNSTFGSNDSLNVSRKTSSRKSPSAVKLSGPGQKLSRAHSMSPVAKSAPSDGHRGQRNRSMPPSQHKQQEQVKGSVQVKPSVDKRRSYAVVTKSSSSSSRLQGRRQLSLSPSKLSLNATATTTNSRKRKLLPSKVLLPTRRSFDKSESLVNVPGRPSLSPSKLAKLTTLSREAGKGKLPSPSPPKLKEKKSVTTPVGKLKVVKMLTSPSASPATPRRSARKRTAVQNSPAKKAASPVKKTLSRAKKVMSPTEEVTSPVKKVPSRATPVEKVKSPVKKVESPAKKVKSPARKVKSPAKKVKSPVKKVKSPVKKVKSPAKKVESPAKKVSRAKRGKQAKTEYDVGIEKLEKDAAPTRRGRPKAVKFDVDDNQSTTASSPSPAEKVKKSRSSAARRTARPRGVEAECQDETKVSPIKRNRRRAGGSSKLDEQGAASPAKQAKIESNDDEQQQKPSSRRRGGGVSKKSVESQPVSVRARKTRAQSDESPVELSPIIQVKKAKSPSKKTKSPAKKEKSPAKKTKLPAKKTKNQRKPVEDEEPVESKTTRTRRTRNLSDESIESSSKPSPVKKATKVKSSTKDAKNQTEGQVKSRAKKTVDVKQKDEKKSKAKKQSSPSPRKTRSSRR